MSNGPQFFETGMGRKFYEGTMPRLVKALETIASAQQPQPVIAEAVELLRGHLNAWDHGSLEHAHEDLIVRTRALLARLEQTK